MQATSLSRSRQSLAVLSVALRSGWSGSCGLHGLGEAFSVGSSGRPATSATSDTEERGASTSLRTPSVFQTFRSFQWTSRPATSNSGRDTDDDQDKAGTTSGQEVESKTDTFNLIPSSNHLVQVHACLPNGFLVGDKRVEGSIIAVGDLWLRWKPKVYSDITMDSLVLVDIVKPIPELLVLGCGPTIRQVDPALMQSLQDRFLGVEALDTKNAVSTFNILNAEGRSVVGAFLVSGTEE